MNTGDHFDFKTHPKKLNANYSSRNLHKKTNHFPEPVPPIIKPARARHTDHTDERNSEQSHSQYQHFDMEQRMHQEGPESYGGESRASHYGSGSNENGIRLLTQKEYKIVELRERLKNIHHFYRIRIEEERSKNIERNEIFIGIIEQLQKNHNEKMGNCRKSLEDMEEEKQELGFVDERMGNIKNTIEQILLQSKELKISNQMIEKELLKKQLVVKEKQAQYLAVKEESNILREKLEQFERLKLKENKKNKQLLEMIQHANPLQKSH